MVCPWRSSGGSREVRGGILPEELAAIAIVGLTASGKSCVAVALSLALGDAEVVSIDSMAVYRGMEKGTAVPTQQERRGVPHHLIGIVDPSCELSVMQFQEAARSVLQEICQRGKKAVLVGGSGLYFQAVVDQLEIPQRYPEVLADLQARAPSGDPEALHRLWEELRRLDPLAASRMDPSNRRRVLRAMEVTLGAGRPFSSFGPGIGHYGRTPIPVIGLRYPPETQAARIRDRIEVQLRSGWLEEVACLLESGRPLSRTASEAVGYRELIAHLQGACSLDEAREKIIRRSLQFARRQWRWFRRDPRIIWVDPEAEDPVELAHWAGRLEWSRN